jgi:hypothetical protein
MTGIRSVPRHPLPAGLIAHARAVIKPEIHARRFPGIGLVQYVQIAVTVKIAQFSFAPAAVGDIFP